MQYTVPNHTDLVDVARRHAPHVLLPVLAKISAEWFLGREQNGWPDPWVIAAVARENIAYSNAHRGRNVVTRADLIRIRDVGRNLADPYITERPQPTGPVASALDRDPAVDSMIVRFVFQQAPFHSIDLFAEIARVLAVFDRDLAALDLETVSATWAPLHGLTLEKFVKVAFLIVNLALVSSGRFDASMFLDPKIEEYGVTADEVLRVFHHYFAAELSVLRDQVKARRDGDDRLRRLDFNHLTDTPFVGFGDGVYVAPSMHLAARRISLTSLLYFVGRDEWNYAFSNDLGHLIEAYVGDQLRLVPSATLTGERTYRVKRNEHRAADFILELDSLTVVFEVKSARVKLSARLSFEAYVDHVKRDIEYAVGKQIRRTVDLIQGGHDVFSDLSLPSDICAVVVTAEPAYMVNSPFYRGLLPDPGVPFAVVSLSELERLVVAARAGGAAGLFRDLTHSADEVAEVIKRHELMHGTCAEPNPLLDAQFSRLTPPQPVGHSV